MYRFFIEEEQIADDFIRIIGDDYNHIVHVLRFEEGKEILISNRQGREYYCIIKEINRDCVLCKILFSQSTDQELPVKVYLFQGIPKNDKMEYIIQKTIELGVYKIIPVVMSRSVVKVNEQNREKKSNRWQKIAHAAAKQAHRGILPKVGDILTFDEAIQYAKQFDQVIVPYEKAESITDLKNKLRVLEPNQSIGIFIGPEGGFDEDEIGRLESIGGITISLGKRILRTETAGLVILSVIMYELEVNL